MPATVLVARGNLRNKIGMLPFRNPSPQRDGGVHSSLCCREIGATIGVGETRRQRAVNLWRFREDSVNVGMPDLNLEG